MFIFIDLLINVLSRMKAYYGGCAFCRQFRQSPGSLRSELRLTHQATGRQLGMVDRPSIASDLRRGAWGSVTCVISCSVSVPPDRGRVVQDQVPVSRVAPGRRPVIGSAVGLSSQAPTESTVKSFAIKSFRGKSPSHEFIATREGSMGSCGIQSVVVGRCGCCGRQKRGGSKQPNRWPCATLRRHSLYIFAAIRRLLARI